MRVAKDSTKKKHKRRIQLDLNAEHAFIRELASNPDNAGCPNITMLKIYEKNHNLIEGLEVMTTDAKI